MSLQKEWGTLHHGTCDHDSIWVEGLCRCNSDVSEDEVIGVLKSGRVLIQGDWYPCKREAETGREKAESWDTAAYEGMPETLPEPGDWWEQHLQSHENAGFQPSTLLQQL